MTTQKKYDPEDIESLLQHKSFDELYPEERAFVLNHMDSPEEYASMRQTLLELQAVDWDQDSIEPRADIKKRLDEEFVKEKKAGFFIWLNTLFAQGKSVSWYRSLGFRVAMGVLVIALVGTWMATRESAPEQIAEVRQESPNTESMGADKDVPEVEPDQKDLEDGNIETLEDPSHSANAEQAPMNEQVEDLKAEGEQLERHDEILAETSGDSFALVAEDDVRELEKNAEIDADMAFDAGYKKVEQAMDLDESAKDLAEGKEVYRAEESARKAIAQDASADFTAEDVTISEAFYSDSVVLADEFRFDNSVGNSVNEAVTVEYTAPAAQNQLSSAVELASIEISGGKAANSQSLKKYKGLLDELYTSR